jgi:hypothetical protein
VVPSPVMGLWRVLSVYVRVQSPRNDFVGLESRVGVQLVNPGTSIGPIQACSVTAVGEERFRSPAFCSVPPLFEIKESGSSCQLSICSLMSPAKACEAQD